MEFPTDKAILNVNQQTANVQSNRNNEVIYSLIEAIPLNVGDKVALYKAFLNIPGQSANTITLERDFTTTMKFCYYTPQDLMSIANRDNTGAANKQTCTNISEIADFQAYQEYMVCPSEHLYEYHGSENEPGLPNISGPEFEPYVQTYQKFTNHYNGPIGAPATLCAIRQLAINTTAQEVGGSPGEVILEPLYQTKSFNIPAGNYTVDGLANRITNLLNGNVLSSDAFKNIVTEHSLSGSNINSFADNKFVFNINVHSLDDNLLALNSVNGMYIGIVNIGNDNGGNVPFDNTKFAFADLRCVNRVLNAGIFWASKADYAIDTTDATSDVIVSQHNFNIDYTPYNNIAQISDALIKPAAVADHFYINKPICPNTKDTNTGARNGLDLQATFSNGFGLFTPMNINERSGAGNTTPGTKTNTNPIPGDSYPSNTYTARLESRRAIGAREFSFNFLGGTVNRFSFENLHTPYKVWTVNQDSGKHDPDQSTPSAAIGNQVSKFTTDNFQQCIHYPVECSSGIMVLSFDFEAVKATKKYQRYLEQYNEVSQNLPAELPNLANTALTPQQKDQVRRFNFLNWALNMQPHDAYFDSEEEAVSSWKESLWNRLGFAYSGIGKISDRREAYFTYDEQLTSLHTGSAKTLQKTLGMITHNNGDLSFATSISGLGLSLKTNDQLDNCQSFDTVGQFIRTPTSSSVPSYITQDRPFATFKKGANSGDFHSISAEYNTVYVQCSSKPVIAEQLPTLSQSPYFIIESDIISNNYLDGKASKKTAVGVVDKQNSSADTVYSTEGIDFTIKQPTILSRFSVRVTNPDGTDVSDDILKENSGFIFIIERAVNPVLPKPQEV